MISDRVKAMINEFNPWWEGKGIIVPEYKRYIFPEIEKYIRTKQIIAVVGLRRVGKTVLIKQVLKGLDVPKENIFYFLFDDVIVQHHEVLEDILYYYLKTIAKEGRKYVFLDEIQKVAYWQDILKRFYDIREDVKFIVSGSASLQIKKSKESLAGRIFDFYLPVLGFGEFLELNDITVEKVGLEKLREFYNKHIHKIPIFEELFIKYIFRGGFPEIAKEEDESIIKSYIKSSIIDKIVLEDIPTVFSVRRKEVLSSILEYCSKETSNLIDITRLSNTLATNYLTVRSYVFYLKNSFVLDLVYNYSSGIARQLRKNKKIHIAHPSITMTMSGYNSNILNVSEVMGKFVETAVFQHSKLLSEKVYFWRTPQKEEVDLVLGFNPLLPIEVKYQSQITPSDTKGLLKFMDLYKLKKGIVVTKDLFEQKQIDGKEILFVPAWLFLLTA